MRVNESYVDRQAVPDVWSADWKGATTTAPEGLQMPQNVAEKDHPWRQTGHSGRPSNAGLHHADTSTQNRRLSRSPADGLEVSEVSREPRYCIVNCSSCIHIIYRENTEPVKAVPQSSNLGGTLGKQRSFQFCHVKKRREHPLNAPARLRWKENKQRIITKTLWTFRFYK